MSSKIRVPRRILCLAAVVCVGCSDLQPEISTATRDPISKKSEVVAERLVVTHNSLSMSLRVKRLNTTAAKAANTVLLLPSATYCTAPNWDLQYEDSSVMDFFAEAGWVVFALDLPGYGDSDNPPEPGTFGAPEAVEYINAAVEYIEESFDVASLNLIGWSWGAQAAGRYANEHPDRIQKLVLYGFTYERRLPQEAHPRTPFRQIDFDSSMTDFIVGCYEPGVPEAYAAAVVEADDAAPSGPLNDYINRLPLVDPKLLPMPLLVICGQYEIEQPPHVDGDYASYFDSRKTDLENFCRKLNTELRIIRGGGHIVHLEKPRDEWRRAVQSFLSDVSK